MDTAKKVINKIRHKFKRPEKPEDPIVKIIAERKAEEHAAAFWERDKKIVRAYNFQKAVIAREQQVDQINAERQRKIEIAELRLKNLKKARRKLAKKREEQ